MLALRVPLFEFATACWGVQTLSLWLPRAEVGRPQQTGWEAASIPAEAALLGLPASSPPAPGSRNIPEVQQLL